MDRARRYHNHHQPRGNKRHLSYLVEVHPEQERHARNRRHPRPARVFSVAPDDRSAPHDHKPVHAWTMALDTSNHCWWVCEFNQGLGTSES
jgi:hypothetical protein